jgi:hypothetical protein
MHAGGCAYLFNDIFKLVSATSSDLEEGVAMRRLDKESRAHISKHGSMHSARTRSSANRTGTAAYTIACAQTKVQLIQKGVQGSGVETANIVYLCEPWS